MFEDGHWGTMLKMCLAISLLGEGIVHPKMKLLSFTHSCVSPNLYDFRLSVQ